MKVAAFSAAAFVTFILTLVILLEDITSKEEYEELDIPVQPMNEKDTTSNNINYDDSIVNELTKKIAFAPHTAKLDFLWRANKDLLNQIKIKDLATYNSILNKFNSNTCIYSN